MDNLARGSNVSTAAHRIYQDLDRQGFNHETVNHSAKEFVNGLANTN